MRLMTRPGADGYSKPCMHAVAWRKGWGAHARLLIDMRGTIKRHLGEAGRIQGEEDAHDQARAAQRLPGLLCCGSSSPRRAPQLLRDGLRACRGPHSIDLQGIRLAAVQPPA